MDKVSCVCVYVCVCVCVGGVCYTIIGSQDFVLKICGYVFEYMRVYMCVHVCVCVGGWVGVSNTTKTYIYSNVKVFGQIFQSLENTV